MPGIGKEYALYSESTRNYGKYRAVKEQKNFVKKFSEMLPIEHRLQNYSFPIVLLVL